MNFSGSLKPSSALRRPLLNYPANHLKTVFLHYNSDPKLKWDADMLGERFLEYMEMLYTALSKKTLDNFWVEGVNLLDNIQDKTLENMADRLRKILDNDKERSKVLKCESKAD